MDRLKMIEQIVDIVMAQDDEQMRVSMRALLKGLGDADLIILHDHYKGV